MSFLIRLKSELQYTTRLYWSSQFNSAKHKDTGNLKLIVKWWSVLVPNTSGDSAHGRPQKFFQGGATSTVCLLHLFDCKPRLMKFFFHHFVRLTIKGGLNFFLYLIERSTWRSDFPRLRFAGQILFSYSLLLSITRTLRCRMDYNEQKAVVVV